MQKDNMDYYKPIWNKIYTVCRQAYNHIGKLADRLHSCLCLQLYAAVTDTLMHVQDLCYNFVRFVHKQHNLRAGLSLSAEIQTWYTNT